jgi:curved DNA-binding protein CbpA
MNRNALYINLRNELFIVDKENWRERERERKVLFAIVTVFESMHVIQEAFGADCDLYRDVLQCARSADKAALRKAYYRVALKHHPDKNSGNKSAALFFQAVTAAYQILQDPDRRAAYDEDGVYFNDDDDNDSTDGEGGADQWKAYFDKIFGKVTVNGIEEFSSRYKCSEEERRDVVREFVARRGNLVQMLDFVMLSEPRDAVRWVEDYIRPAMEDGGGDGTNAPDLTKYKDAMEKSLKNIQKKVEKEMAAAAPAEDDDEDDDADQEEDSEEEEAEIVADDDETETDDESDPGDESAPVSGSGSKRKRHVPPPLSPRKDRGRKAAATNAATTKSTAAATKKGKMPNNVQGETKNRKNKKASRSSGKEDMSDLIAQIQSRRGGGSGGSSSIMAKLGARYGVPDNDDDPLADDKEFAKIQAKLDERKKKKRT